MMCEARQGNARVKAGRLHEARQDGCTRQGIADARGNAGRMHEAMQVGSARQSRAVPQVRQGRCEL
jgi:hypothetical protein